MTLLLADEAGIGHRHIREKTDPSVNRSLSVFLNRLATNAA
jgi:hypothetical protein